MFGETFEALACALAGHAELSANDAPGQSTAVGGEGCGLDSTLGFAPGGCSSRAVLRGWQRR